MHWSKGEIRELCDAFEENVRSQHPKQLRDWLQSHVANPPRKLLLELQRIEREHKRSAGASVAGTEYLSDSHPTHDDVTDEIDSVTCDISAAEPPVQRPVRRVGRFQVIRELGRGGFGCVYLAHDETLKREVALKVPLAFLEGQARERFMREAEAAASLDHVGIVPVFDAGETDGSFYIASAYCPGKNLSQWLKQQQEVPLESCAEIVRCIAEAVQHAHNRGVAHRDLKPGNVMLVPIEEERRTTGLRFVPRITDFGMAKLVERRMEDTHSSVMLGTPAYMAPEQFAGGESRHPFAADIYAIGVILYELLTAQRPHEGSSLVEVMDAVRSGVLVPPRKLRTDIPNDLETICLKCLNKVPENRYESCADLVDDLSRFLRGVPIRARRPTLRQKIRSWGTSPARAVETGMLTVFLSIGIPIWITSIILMAWMDGLQVSITLELVPQAAMLFVLIMLPSVWAGYRTIQGHRKWAWAGLVLSAVGLPLTIPPLFGHVFVFPEMYARYPLGRIVAYTYTALLYGIQTLQYAAILRFTPRNFWQR